jgi:hypothetical protein
MEEQKYEDHKYDPPAGCFLRLFWMTFGNVLLLACAYGITMHQTSLLSIADVLYWAMVGSLLAARYVDIRYLQGTTADGDPATLAHWRRYAAIVGVVSAILWLGAHTVAYYRA